MADLSEATKVLQGLRLELPEAVAEHAISVIKTVLAAYDADRQELLGVLREALEEAKEWILVACKEIHGDICEEEEQDEFEWELEESVISTIKSALAAIPQIEK